MGDAGNNGDAKITLYTNHRCPWAHRAHIAIKELGLDFEEVIIDLDNPRPEWYLKINPRGLVPAIKFDHPAFGKPQDIIESSLVVHFLLDAYPQLSQKIWPTPINVEATHFRYRVNLFVETFFSKVQPHYWKLLLAANTDVVDERIETYVGALREHIEPLLVDAKPFFGGSSSVTLAEILTAPFVLRLYTMANGKFLPLSFLDKANELTNFSAWAHATISRESVTYFWNKEQEADEMLARLPKMREKFGYSVK